MCIRDRYQLFFLFFYLIAKVHHRYDRGERHRRMWDDDLVLKCKHDALVPAFDPRPGRTNIQQTQDIEIPTSGTLRKTSNNSKYKNKI